MTRITGVGCAGGKSGLGSVYDGPVMQKGTVHMIDSVCFRFSSDVPCSGDFLFPSRPIGSIKFIIYVRPSERMRECVLVYDPVKCDLGICRNQQRKSLFDLTAE